MLLSNLEVGTISESALRRYDASIRYATATGAYFELLSRSRRAYKTQRGATRFCCDAQAVMLKILDNGMGTVEYERFLERARRRGLLAAWLKWLDFMTIPF